MPVLLNTLTSLKHQKKTNVKAVVRSASIYGSDGLLELVLPNRIVEVCGSQIIAVRTSVVENYPVYFGLTGGRKLSDTLGTAGGRELFDILGEGYVLISI